MTNASVSSNYRQLRLDEVAQVAEECANAWKDTNIPDRQYEIVAPELERYRTGGHCAPFTAFINCLRTLPANSNSPHTRILDIGASGGYYNEVLKIKGFAYDYRACDFSPTFKALAERLYPGIRFDVADATRLPYLDGSFDIVANCAVLMHERQYERVIAETVRVASSFVLFHRTPITYRDTEYFVKEGYGVPMLEIHFGIDELMSLFTKYGLTPLNHENVFFDFQKARGHRTFLLKKDPVVHHPV